MIAFGAAMGALFAVAYVLCLGRVGNVRPRTLAMLLAAGGFLGVYMVPFVKYPANPPSAGHPETIAQRGGFYLLMVLLSVVLLIAAVWFGQRLRGRFGTWNAALLAGAAFVVAVGIVMALLPQLGHLPFNEQTYGNHATETPLPLTNAKGTIVYPGFPADVLFNFRLYSVAAQLIDAATSTVTGTIPVGSGPIGVAVDPAAGTVYVANNGESEGEGTVSVIDAATSTVTATIPVGSYPAGVAVDPAAGTVRLRGQRRRCRGRGPEHGVADRCGHRHRDRHHPGGLRPVGGGGGSRYPHGLRDQLLRGLGVGDQPVYVISGAGPVVVWMVAAR